MHIFILAQHASVSAAHGAFAFLADAEPAKPAATLLSGIAALVSALAWPAIATILLVTQRRPLERLICAIVNLAESANKIEISSLKVERQIAHEASRSEILAQADPADPMAGTTPGAQAEAATRVGKLIDVIPPSSAKERVIQSVKENMEAFAQEYESLRGSLPPGPERTRRMNGVAAKMRTLAIPAKPYLSEFSLSPSPGKRLAAICILEIDPNLTYLDWLVARMKIETPFVFFHASIALTTMVKVFGFEAHAQLYRALDDALAAVKSYEGGPPDENTVVMLERGLDELRRLGENANL